MLHPDIAGHVAIARAAAARSPVGSRLHANLSRVLAKAGRKHAGRLVLEEARRLPCGDAADCEALGFAAFQLDLHRLSRDFYEDVVRLVPHDGLAYYNLASAERNLGNVDDAERACGAALSCNRHLFQASLLLSQLRRQTHASNHVDRLRQTLDRCAGSASAQIFLNYALGKELDDLQEFDAAFDHFERGARARRQALDYSVQRDVEIATRIARNYPKHVRPLNVPAAHDLGFIIGMPRSGTTLVERVLTGDTAVSSNGETDNFATALLRSAAEGGPDIVERAAAANPLDVASRYRQLAKDGSSASLVLEKLPSNFLYVGAIANSLPSAPIILVRRNALDNCLGMFTTLFGSAYPFSYDLVELGEYFSAFDRLMQHWKDNFGSSILEVSYEALVSNPEPTARAFTAYAGLQWNDELLAVEHNTAPSTTASAVQVRQPIYRTAQGRWRNYAARLEPLLVQLKAHGVAIED